MTENKPMTVGELIEKLKLENPKAVLVTNILIGYHLYIPRFKRIKIKLTQGLIVDQNDDGLEALSL